MQQRDPVIPLSRTSQTAASQRPFDVLDVLRARWKTCFALAVIGALAGALLASALPKRYEASGIVKVGQFGLVTALGAVQTSHIEAPTDALDRMRSRGFQLAVAEALTKTDVFKDVAADDLADAVSGVQLKMSKGNNLIEVTYRAESPERAALVLRAFCDTLVKRHQEVLDATRGVLKKRLDQTTQALQQMDGPDARARAGRGSEASQALQQLNRINEGDRIIGLQQLQVALEAALLPPTSVPTAFAEQMSTGKRPAFPRTSFVALSGLLLGLLAAGAVLLFHSVRSARR